MSNTSVISGRVDSLIRLKAERQLKRSGLTANDVIRNTWTYIANTGKIPESAKYSANKETEGGLLRLEKLRAAMPKGTPLDTMTAADLKKALANRE